MRHRSHRERSAQRGPLAASAAAPPPQRGLLRDAGEVLGLNLLTAVALSCIFPPIEWWPLAFVALVPWTVATCRAQRAWLVHWLSFFVGWGFYLANLYWLAPVTVEGYVALAFYLALYWTLAAWAVRTGRRHGIAPVWTLPVVWVACEFLRATVMTGFPWFFLAHGLYRQLPLIQICDLTGAYGVSFLAALVNGALVMFALRRWPAPHFRPGKREIAIGGTVAAALLVATLAYGYFRLHQVDFEHDPKLRGPRVAVVQHDFPLIPRPPYGAHPYEVFASYLRLGAEAADARPDLVAFPETISNTYQNIAFVKKGRLLPELALDIWQEGKRCHEAVAAFARGDYATANGEIERLEAAGRERGRMGPEWSLPRLPPAGGSPVTTLLGTCSVEQSPEVTYPKVRQYNSALVYDRDGTQRPERYDKKHLVPFGEFVPFRNGRLHGLYRWLNKLSPFSRGGRIEYSLTPGRELTVFELPTDTGSYRFGTPICYEDTMPYLIRDYVWDGPRRRVDFLVNISNDGWFGHRSELPQHLAACCLRAVENRVGIARAVNTGISGFIDPNGRIYSLVRQDGRSYGPGIIGYDVQPVYLDRRTSLYGRVGDLFALTCVLLTSVLWLSAVFERWVLALRQRIGMWLARRSGK
jgi:apolipoprotein N-acyltransferase